MTLNELRYIIAVGETLNFRRAAELCFISQPALSLAIRKLENELDVQIFERNKNEVLITAVGKRILEQARLILEETGRLKTIAQDSCNQLTSVLRLGVIHTIGPYLLPEVIPLLHQKAPQMPLEIEENTTAILEQLLRIGRIDAAIVALPFDSSGIVTRPLYDEHFVVVVPRNHPWAVRTAIDPADLPDQKVLRLTGEHCFSNQIVEVCPELQRQNDNILQGNSLETIRNMVASGLGITVLPAHAIHRRYNSPLLVVIPFCEPAPSRRIALAYRRTFNRQQAIDVLIEAIEELPHSTLDQPQKIEPETRLP